MCISIPYAANIVMQRPSMGAGRKHRALGDHDKLTACPWKDKTRNGHRNGNQNPK